MSNEGKNKEKRRHVRVKMPFVIKYRSDKAKSTESWDAVIPINMSESGIAFFSLEQFEKDSGIHLLVTNPVQKEERVYACKVLRSDQSKARGSFFETVVTIEKMADDSKEMYIKALNSFRGKNE